MRRLADRLVRLLARTANLGWFRSVEVAGLEKIPRSGPVLIAASHHGGFVDPALLVATIPRPVRFLAMASLWRILPLRPLLSFAGAIPVQRAQDGATGRHVDAFAACFDHLRAGGAIGIFPEGEASDAPHLLPIRTGVARIALGAHSRGAMGLRIVPVGLIYEDKQRARSRAYVRVGEPIELDADLATNPGVPPDESDRAAVALLMRRIEERLADASIDFESADQRSALRLAASVALRPDASDPAERPPVGDVERLADRLSEAPAELEADVRSAAVDYREALDANRVSDAVVAPGAGEAFRRRAGTSWIVTLALAPLAMVGLVANAFPTLGVYAVGTRAMAPVTHATAKFLAGIVLSALDWALLRWVVFDGASRPWLFTLAAGPVCGLAAMWVVGRAIRARRARLGLRRLAGATAALEELRARPPRAGRPSCGKRVGRTVGAAGSLVALMFTYDADQRRQAADHPGARPLER